MEAKCSLKASWDSYCICIQHYLPKFGQNDIRVRLKETIHPVAEPELVKDYDASLMDDLGKISSDLISTYKERVCVNPLLQWRQHHHGLGSCYFRTHWIGLLFTQRGSGMDIFFHMVTHPQDNGSFKTGLAQLKLIV